MVVLPSSTEEVARTVRLAGQHKASIVPYGGGTGVMGAADSGTDESFESGLLEYPHYTRPQVWEGRTIPDVLTSGHHKQIADWRAGEAKRLTKTKRPDLWAASQKRTGADPSETP